MKEESWNSKAVLDTEGGEKQGRKKDLGKKNEVLGERKGERD